MAQAPGIFSKNDSPKAKKISLLRYPTTSKENYQDMLVRMLSKCCSSTIAIAVLLTHLTACNNESGAPQTVREIKVHSIKVVYPPEARTLVTQATDRINAKNLTLSTGSIVRLSASSFDNLAALEKIGSPQMPALLWIAPLSPLAASLKRSTQSDVTITDCNSIMSSRLGVSYRKIDAFSIPEKDGQVEASSLFLRDGATPTNLISVVAGSPRFTSSGLAAALSAAAAATSTPLGALTSDSVVQGAKAIRATQRGVRNYFISDYTTLSWLNERQGGESLAVLTTEQAYTTHRMYTPTTTLQWSPTTSPSVTLDYPLCNVNTKTDSAQDVEAAKLVRVFLASDEFKSLLGGAGFSPPTSLGNLNIAQLGAAAASLIAEWSTIRRPSITVFVVDASIKTDRAAMETIRREIKSFFDSRPSPNDTIAVISASSTPELICEPTTNPELVTLALARLSTTGGNAIRDGIQTAFTILSDLTNKEYRRAVVVFTSGKDTSSQTSVTQLSNRASQLVGRKNVELFVLGIGSRNPDFGELPNLVQQAGGTFIQTDLASLPAELFPVARQVQ